MAKLCNKCGQEKEEFDFYPRADHPHLLQSHCKRCVLDNRKLIPKSEIKIKNRKANLKKKYGLTLEAYEALLAEQEGSCFICHSEEDLVVDHDHDTGDVRGILCRKCNSGLGMFKDNPELLTKAAEYLYV